jgi:hypothetical protein
MYGVGGFSVFSPQSAGYTRGVVHNRDVPYRLLKTKPPPTPRSGISVYFILEINVNRWKIQNKKEESGLQSAKVKKKINGAN